MFRFAHISDLHFSKVCYSLSQFFSKRWIGNLNVFFSRKNKLQVKPLWALEEMIQDLYLDYIIVTGDLTSTSRKEEFVIANSYFTALKEKGVKIFFLPGNHDHYTKSAAKQKLFYQYFANPIAHPDLPSSFYSLLHHGVEAHLLQNNWWLVLLDTTSHTSLLSSRGYFTKPIENNLRDLLKKIPQNSKVILANHFSLSTDEGLRKILVGSNNLQKIIQENPQIYFYLHGHTHLNKVLYLEEKKLPIILDSGSLAHTTLGAFNVVTLKDSRCEIDIFHWEKEYWALFQKSKWDLLKK